ncbi:MAG: SCO family protein [Terriglobales bacterium]
MSRVFRTMLWSAAALAIAFVLPAAAQQEAPAPDSRPPLLRQVAIEQRLDQQVPLELAFRDHTGRAVRLGDYFGPRPVVLALVYFQCPMLCTQVLNGMTSSLSVLRFNAGQEFDVLAVSFDPRETPAMAAASREKYLQRYGRPGSERGWHFLTGPQASIDALTAAAGFRYAFDPATGQFAHGSAILVLTPEGRIAQYYYGIEYPPKDLRLGLIEASKNRIGTVVDQVLLYCYHYDPATGRYGAITMNILRLAGGATVLVLGSFIAFMLRRDFAHGRLKAGS